MSSKHTTKSKLISISISFKRKLKAPSKLSLPSFLSPTPALQGRSSTAATPHLSSARIRKLREQSHKNGSDLDISTDDGFAADGNGGNDVKDGPLDWYGDGPRRRVGYDDLTAIDWIFEYTKERQRLRNLYSKAHGWLGQANQFLDASTVWIVLIATGLSVGLLAAAIDVVSDWLGDIKTGFCHSGVEGGQFYLNRGFCCWGYQGMHPTLFHIQLDQPARMVAVSGLDSLGCRSWLVIRRRKIHGGICSIHSIFREKDLSFYQYTDISRSPSPSVLASSFETSPNMPNTVVYRRSRQFSVVSSFVASWARGL